MLLCFIVPPPLVQAVAPIKQVVGQSLTLQCKITAVSDIASTVDIMWTNGGSEVRRVNVPGSLIHNFTDYFTIPVLSRSDNDQEYQCVVVINTTPILRGNDSVVLNVTRKYIKLVYPIMYTNPPKIKANIRIHNYLLNHGIPWYIK